LLASFGMGNLQFQHIEETTDGPNQLIQKYNCKFEQGTLNKFSLIIEGLLQQAVQSNLQVHVNTMGPGEWMSK
jgi:hypothetical protein